MLFYSFAIRKNEKARDPLAMLFARALVDALRGIKSRNMERRLNSILWLAHDRDGEDFLSRKAILDYFGIDSQAFESSVRKMYGIDLERVRKVLRDMGEEIAYSTLMHREMDFFTAYKWVEKLTGKEVENA